MVNPTYYIKSDDRFWKVGILWGILNRLGLVHSATILQLHQGRGHHIPVKWLHVSHTPAKHLENKNDIFKLTIFIRASSHPQGRSQTWVFSTFNKDSSDLVLCKATKSCQLAPDSKDDTSPRYNLSFCTTYMISQLLMLLTTCYIHFFPLF